MVKLNIQGKDKAEILASLYNRAKPQGMGILHFDDSIMGKEEAEELLKERFSFDYLKGRVMKVDLSGDVLDTRLYDRDNGEGAAEKVIENCI